MPRNHFWYCRYWDPLRPIHVLRLSLSKCGWSTAFCVSAGLVENNMNKIRSHSCWLLQKAAWRWGVVRYQISRISCYGHSSQMEPLYSRNPFWSGLSSWAGNWSQFCAAESACSWLTRAQIPIVAHNRRNSPWTESPAVSGQPHKTPIITARTDVTNHF